LDYSSILKIEAESISDMSVNLGTTQCDIPEDSVFSIIICVLGTEILGNLCGELQTADVAGGDVLAASAEIAECVQCGV
jgi:hypothetical protein